MTDVVLLSRYERLGASSRLRSYQYLPALRAHGLGVKVCAMLDDAYLRARHQGSRPLLRVLDAYRRRLRDLIGSRGAPILWVEYEALPWLPFFVERMLIDRRARLLIDYDDAIFHRYDAHANVLVRAMLGRKIDRLMRLADVVVAGNEYLAARARDAGCRRVEVIPTVIDLARYRQKIVVDSKPLIVGWIGSPSTTHYLRELENAFRDVADQRALCIMNVGGEHWTPQGLDVDNVAWSEDGEIDAMLRFDVGVMPLDDNPWSRGKCGLKLIQYMGCGLPTIASPVGANLSIVQEGRTGIFARSNDEWTSAIGRLADDVKLRGEMGRAGFERVREHYSLDVTAPKVVALVVELLQRRASNA
ncbi:MAG TPA: glycosyltransferase family 4 protein [Casimicrobiaceae bacterium]|nr:glycosyltransferase family 4 protein [Casimicrobiaceae bacterium]